MATLLSQLNIKCLNIKKGSEEFSSDHDWQLAAFFYIDKCFISQ